MSKKTLDNVIKSNVVFEVDPIECPFREFRDNELQIEYWGMGPVAFRASSVYVKTPTKPVHDAPAWIDDQTQPLPRSARRYLHGWIRAENLAMNRWEAEVAIFDENNGNKMVIADIQLSHAQVLQRSSFCRRILSACFMLERVEGILVEHQWENFVCNFGPEGWRAKCHIYSPGTKPGGGTAHKPGLSKNGCYLVRLFYLGAWRCIWVSDQVPVDATDSPLLPFSPLQTRLPAKTGTKQVPPTVTAGVVYLWPLLLCKALLKLAAPDMNSDENTRHVEDELMEEFDIMQSLTGAMNLSYKIGTTAQLWNLIINEVAVFAWDDDDETQPSTIKSRSTKKPTAKEAATTGRNSIIYVNVHDTKNLAPYHLPGITPGHEMSLLITMARDIPLKKPLPEPEVALWKYYRWVDWARNHGLYEAYDCPRTKFLKVNGLMKLSHAPHLLDVQSTESITPYFVEDNVKSNQIMGDDGLPKKKEKKTKEQIKTAINAMNALKQATKEEMREWIQYIPLHGIVKDVRIMYYPSMFQFSSAGSNPPIRSSKAVVQKVGDSYIHAPKSAPLYLQIDGPEESKLRMSLRTVHPRILSNAGAPVDDIIEPAHMVLERFEWFLDTAVAIPKAYVKTRGYTTVEVKFDPGRHFCRIWTHSRMNWHLMCLSESTLLLGTRDVIQGAAVRECPWASKFLLALGTAFTNWVKVERSNPLIMTADREFFRSYVPDLEWDNVVVGYDRVLLHWMFRQALQSLLAKKLTDPEYKATCIVLRKYFCDPDFGFPPKPLPPRSVREIANLDVCDCVMPEIEEVECIEEHMEEQVATEEKPIVQPNMMDELLLAPKPPITSQVCELASEELPCGILKDEREKVIRKHEAAVTLQAYWRGTWARKCLKSNVIFTTDITKYVQEHAFGNLEALSNLMNEFFGMFPGAKYAYSVASALSGAYGLHQYVGATPVTYKCKWIPYFQGVFYCHYPVKVHFDVQSSIPHSSVAVYDNDSGKQLPQAFNTHKTFDIQPNYYGYTVTGHGSLNQAPGINYEAQWQLTVMSCIEGAFHICDNEDPCRELPLSHTSKLHLDEIFLPNRRNILGGIQLSVTKHESVSFRAAATSQDLEMVATLRSILPNGETEEISKCSGKGEIFWPYIRLESMVLPKIKSLSQAYLSGKELTATSVRSLTKTGKQGKPSPASKQLRSTMKLKPAIVDPKLYSIEVVCPWGWPLTLVQWKRVDEVRNSLESTKYEQPPKKVIPKDKPSKPGSAKEKEKSPIPFTIHMPLLGDAYVELECGLAIGGGTVARRDDDRDLSFANARKSWDAKDPGRNQRGAQIRKEFRTEFLEVPAPQPSESYTSAPEEIPEFEEALLEEDRQEPVIQIQGPSPVTESDILETTAESEEEAIYLMMPEQLRDKFTPLYFVPFCTKEKNEEETILLTLNMAEAAKRNREARIEAALERMRELQAFNEEFVLGRQKYRCNLLEKLFVDAQWCPQLQQVLDERDEAIATEILNRSISATKKKQEAKKK